MTVIPEISMIQNMVHVVLKIILFGRVESRYIRNAEKSLHVAGFRVFIS